MYQRAIVHKFGEASNVVQLDRYVPGALPVDGVRIRMSTRSINPSDLITISGAYRSRTSLPLIPGFEGVGIVEALGNDVRALRKGARVVPIGSAGAWQDVKDCPAAWCLTVPDGVTDEQAASSFVNPMTAWAMLHEVARVQPGMRIAVTAAGSAIGQMIIRLANEIGLIPIAFVRSERAQQNIQRLAAEVIRYEDHFGFTALDDRLSSSKGVDAIFDCIGGTAAISLARLLCPNGMFVHYGLLSGQPIPAEFWSIRRDIDFSMFHLRNWIREVPLEKVRQTYAQVSSLIGDGIIQTKVRKTYQLQSVKAALLDARTASADGKVQIAN
jgi:NADPH:quinone reductase-like Zn-dependent oxidoreductase